MWHPWRDIPEGKPTSGPMTKLELIKAFWKTKLAHHFRVSYGFWPQAFPIFGILTVLTFLLGVLILKAVNEDITEKGQKHDECRQACYWTGGSMLGENDKGCFCVNTKQRWKVAD